MWFSHLARSLFDTPSGVFLLCLSVLGSQVTVVGCDFRQSHVRMSFEKELSCSLYLDPLATALAVNSLLAIIDRRLRGGLHPTNWTCSLAYQLHSAVEENSRLASEENLHQTQISCDSRLSWIIPVKVWIYLSFTLCMLYIRPSPFFVHP